MLFLFVSHKSKLHLKANDVTFYRYLPAYHLQTYTLQHVNRHTQSTEFVARSSPDPVLTAFAQLGTLRLDAKRSLISLFGRHDEHILAEATRTLSPRDTTDHKAHDEIWIGSCIMSYDRSFSKALLNSPNDQLLFVPDLTQDEEFRGHQDVTNHPHVRFLASSPIISPKGIVIGAYTILDDKPHGPLDVDVTKFLVDISNTVMDYLDATRSRRQHLRSERMIVGLGSFLEGKGSLRNSWINDNEDLHSPDEDNVEGHINERQQEKQISDDVAQAMTKNTPRRHLPFHTPNFNTHRDKKHTTQNAQQQLLARSTISTIDFPKPRQRPTTTAPDDEKTRKQLPKEIYTAQIKEAFSRAANIIRESIEVEAAVFFDASFGSQEALVDTSKSDSETGSVGTCSSSDDETKAQRIFTQRELLSIARAEHVGKSAVNPCRILGFSASDASSVNDQPMGDNKIALSETFLGHLLRRYPSGKIFNFGEDGSISSDETSDGVFKDFFRRSGGKKYKRTHKATVRQDAATLLHLAPNARSIVFSPLWDSHKERWYAGCLSWTKVPHRVLTSNDELTFLFAFGNSVMAEVHRLGALLAERAKADLLAGISHELRSPLHGIFGMVDILNGTDMGTLQRGFVHTISSCAFTLLGSIDQLLEYASINDVRPKSQPVKSLDRFGVRAKQDLQPGTGDENFVMQLDIAVEDTIESLFAGYSFFGDSSDHFGGNLGHPTPDNLRGRVMVVLDIDRAQSFQFSNRPGAWHVILTNIVGNSMKFTEEGYIYVSLKTVPVKFDSDGHVTRSKVTLTVRDTGCGMEQEFLKNELSTAFSQEDNLSAGNGLGFNITGRIVSSLGGDIQVKSQKGVGTEVVTTVTLDHISESASRDGSDKDLFPIATNALVCEKTIGIFDSGTSDGEVALRSSLQKICRDWFQADAQLVAPSDAKFAECDVYILPHESLHELSLRDMCSFPSADKRLPPPVIVVCSSPRIAHSMFLATDQQPRGADVVEFISQPCGPRKLAKTLEICLRRQQRRLDLVRDKGGIAEFRTSDSPPLPPKEFDRKSFFQLRNAGNDQRTASTQGSSKSSEALEPNREGVDNSCASGVKQSSAEEFPPQRNSPATVLLVDDNDINIKLLIAYMKKLGCNYLVAQNGQEALDSFKENAFSISIVLMGKLHIPCAEYPIVG